MIRRVGPFALSPRPGDTFESLLPAVVSQQLHAKAAAAIHARIVAVLGGEVTPARFQRASNAMLRCAGLSAAKREALRDLAGKCADGTVAPRRELETLGDAEIVARLTQVRGVGVWTAQMFLIFRLGRPDVLPSGDFAIRKAFGLLYRKNGRLPPPSAVERHGRAWAPYRSVASWYLWRSLDVPAAD